jgi:hypothetical protein
MKLFLTDDRAPNKAFPLLYFNYRLDIIRTYCSLIFKEVVMCCGGGLPYGIPIEEEVHNQFSEPVKEAWKLFNDWWTKVYIEAHFVFVDESTMPADVKAARELILETPIPGYDGYTCKDSCYMIGVQRVFDMFEMYIKNKF